MNKSWNLYNSGKTGDFFDELITDKGRPRQAARAAIKMLQGLPDSEMLARRGAAELAIREMGISFTIYSEGKNIFEALELTKGLISENYPQEFKTIVNYFKHFFKG